MIADPATVGPQDIRQAFTHRDTHPLALHDVLLEQYGLQYAEWEPETLWVEIDRDYGTSSAANKTKIQAVRTALMAPFSVTQWELFEILACGFEGIPPKFDYIQKVPPPRGMFAARVINRLYSKPVIGDEVMRYMAASLLSDGYLYAPTDLAAANQYMIRYVSENEQAQVAAAVESALSNGTPVPFDTGSKLFFQTRRSLALVNYVQYWDTVLDSQRSRLLGVN